jgi:hypothetical protein
MPSAHSLISYQAELEPTELIASGPEGGGMELLLLRTLNAAQGSRKGLDAVGIYGISA